MCWLSYRVDFEITNFKPCRKNDIVAMLRDRCDKCSVKRGIITAKLEVNVPRCCASHADNANMLRDIVVDEVFELNHVPCDNDECLRCDSTEPCIVEASDDWDGYYCFNENHLDSTED
jgi:hypothetical protein